MNTPSSPLEKALAETLDRANTQLEPAVSARLSHLRAQALLTVTATHPGQRWLAVAATVAVCALTLGVSHRLLPNRDAAALLASQSPPLPTLIDPDLPSAVWAEDPQMLADWEMLYVLGDEPDAG